jgi:hypothetical protein
LQILKGTDMQSYNNLPSRNSTSSPGIDSKVSVKAGKQGQGLGNTSESPVKAGAAKSAPKGFNSGLINPKIKC